VSLAEEPDNVDVLCKAKVQNRAADLVVAAFRRDKTQIGISGGCERGGRGKSLIAEILKNRLIVIQHVGNTSLRRVSYSPGWNATAEDHEILVCGSCVCQSSEQTLHIGQHPNV